MSLLDMFAAQAAPVSQPAIATPSTPGERFSAEFDAALAPDRYFNLRSNQREGWQSTIDQLHAATGTALPNPYADRVTTEEIMRLGSKAAVMEERKQKIRDARNALLQDAGVGDVIPDPDAVDREIGERGTALRNRAASLVDTGNGLSAFAGGALAPTPENIAGLLIPPSRAVFGATTVARGFLANLGREAAYQAVTQGALTAGAEALDTVARSETGTAPTLGEAAGNVLMGAAAGAVLGGTFHVLHAAPRALWERWNRLPEPVRENAPLEVRDAMKVIEADTLYGDANRLGLPWAMHERYQREAMDPILRGRALSADELRPADTPMTALGTILRNAPDRIEPEGLRIGAARVAQLSDADLEPFVRQTKPSAFKAADEVNAKLAGIEERRAAIQREADQIGVPDVIDLDTAAILNDIEERLKKPALRRADRLDLERQRAQWIQTLDVHGGLTADLVRMRKEFFPEHGPALRALAEERDQLQQELGRARGEVQREIDFLRSKLEAGAKNEPRAAVWANKDHDIPVEVMPEAPRQGPDGRLYQRVRHEGRDSYVPADELKHADSATPLADGLGFKTPADMAKALEAAEFDRIIRTVRQNVPREPRARPAAEPLAPDPIVAEALDQQARALIAGKPTVTNTAKARLEVARILETAARPGAPKAFVDLGHLSPSWVVSATRSHGHDIGAFSHVLEADAVRHMKASHGAASERGRGQIPLTDADFDKIPELLADPDRVIFNLQRRRGGESFPAIGFMKTQPDGTILYLEEVRAGRGRLAAFSMRKHPAVVNADSIVSTLDPYSRSKGAPGGGDAPKVVKRPADGKGAPEHLKPAAKELDQADEAVTEAESITGCITKGAKE